MKIYKWIETEKMRQIVPYDLNWPIIYQKVKKYIKDSIPDVLVEHIGSTSVPGLWSKNMIDLLVISQNQDIHVLKKFLIGLGFHEREIWVDTDEKPYVGGSLTYDGKEYDINTHICRNGSQSHVQTLMFREALLVDKKLRHKYERVKHEAIENAGTDPKAYNDYKSNFILEAIESQIWGTCGLTSFRCLFALSR